MISIIIPVYNAAPYLRRCIDSVLANTFGCFEILLINDGSTDGSLEICSDYTARDGRIRLFTQENQGVSAARNKGISEARGEWILFLDADDFISHDFLSMAGQPEYQYADIILFQFSLYASPGGQAPAQGPHAQGGQAGGAYCQAKGGVRPHCYQDGEMLQLLRRILVPQPLEEGGSLDFRTPCARAYKKSILEQYSIRFSPGIKIGEDLLFNLEYQLKARSCVFIPRTVYYYDVHGDSSSHHFNPGLRENHARLMLAVRDALEKSGMFPSLEPFYYSYALENLAYVLIRDVFSPHSPRNYRESRRLCREMHQNPVYRKAFKYNRTTGILPRRALVLCFRWKCFLLVKLISRVSYAYLEKR